MTFFVQHFLGLDGMPRRVATYPEDPDWIWMNMLSTTGSIISTVAIAIFLVNIYLSLRRGRTAGPNPWSGWTLEWATTSPPPVHNFVQVPPIRGRRPLWDLAHPDDPDVKRDDEARENPKETSP